MDFIDLKNYQYELPQHRIALYPLPERDESKLLVWRKGRIEHSHFKNLASHLPENTFLFFNNTKVIPARILFHKTTGAAIEVFLLSPVSPSSEVSQAMTSRGTCEWLCTIGNLKKWTDGQSLIHPIGTKHLIARLADRATGRVSFEWTADFTFAEVVELAGKTPLPPYLHREVEESDKSRYQTIYSEHAGAVAAPTAGLHFTDTVFASLTQQKIEHDFITLHVSAGTFQPIKTNNANDHAMHAEQFMITRSNIENLLRRQKFIVPVGTTSMRTLESVYWIGAKLTANREAALMVNQHDPYQITANCDVRVALEAILHRMESVQQDRLVCETSIFIRPGYTFKICQGLITNFHQPASTLILLVAAFTQNDWRNIYQEALENDYRFLSYGDSSLLIP